MRTVTGNGGQLVIEYNPTRPRARVRYSIAHEIAHTLFPDCAAQVRNRERHRSRQDDNWQLELLCNIAAAEFLMPFGSFPELRKGRLSIDQVLQHRKLFEVSTEAVLLRTAKIAQRPCAVFSARRVDSVGGAVGAYRLEYLVKGRGWRHEFPKGLRVPVGSVLSQCSAIGYTAKGKEVWTSDAGELALECVGLPPHPGDRFPRVAGILLEPGLTDSKNPVSLLRGDATQPRAKTNRIGAQVVNDKTPNWGGEALRSRSHGSGRQYNVTLRHGLHQSPMSFHLATAIFRKSTMKRRCVIWWPSMATDRRNALGFAIRR